MLSSAMRLPERTARATGETGFQTSIVISLPSTLAVDRHRAALGQRLDAVADRVLEQRLQQQARHERTRRQRVDLPAHAQPVAEPQLLDALVGARNFDFLAQRDLGRACRSG